MKLKPEDYKTIQSYTGRKIRFIADVKSKVEQSAQIANNAIINMMSK